MATINESLTQITDELKQTNRRYGKATEEYSKMVAVQSGSMAALSGIGGAIKNNLTQSTAGFQSFLDQLEALPVFGAISGIAKTLGGKLFGMARQRAEDKRIAKQLGITKEEVAIRRKEQELLVAQEENNAKLLDAAKMLGYTSEQFEALTNAQATGEMTAAEVEKAREDRRANERLTAAVEGVGKDISNLELGEDEENKGFLSGILDSVKGFIPAIGAALTTLGTTLMGGLVALGTKIVLALKGGLGGLGKLMKKIPGGKALGNIFKKGLSGLKGLGGAAGNIASKAGGGLLKSAGGIAKMGLKAAKFIPGAGLAVTAASGLWDGLTAGFKEFKESGSLTSALKEGTAGALSGLTFGLIDQETISNGMSAIGDFAKKGWDGFTNLAGGAMEGLSNLGSSVGGWFSSWWSDEEEGIKEENEKSGGILDSVTGGMKAAADGYANLYGSAFDALGSGVESLTGIEMPSFDDVKEKVGNFANNMKDGIAKGWESVTETASNAWSGVKSFFGFGGDEEKEEPSTSYPSGIQLGYTPNSTEKVFFKFGPNGEYIVEPDQNKAAQEYTGQLMAEPLEDETAATTGIASNIANIADQVKQETASIFSAVKSFFGFGGGEQAPLKAEMVEEQAPMSDNEAALADIQQRRAELAEKYKGSKSKIEQNRIKTADRQLARQELDLTQKVAAEKTQYPNGIQLGYVPGSPERVYFKFGPNGEYLVEADQGKAAQEYAGLSGNGSSNGDRLQNANATSAEISREYMRKGSGSTTVVNAPNNSTTVAGGGGGTAPIPIATKDNNSSAASAAYANF